MYIKAVIFDFDGVLVESNQIKVEAFRSLFLYRPDKTEEIISYHIENMGISRFVKFQYIFEHIFKEPYSDEIGLELGKKFSEIVIKKVLDASFIGGVKKFLANNHMEYHLFVASGTPENELLYIMKKKGIDKYFKGIYGSPAAKNFIISNILHQFSLKSDEVVFVGDAETDMKAAKECNVRFVLRKTSENGGLHHDKDVIAIDDLKQLKEIIKEIKR